MLEPKSWRLIGGWMQLTAVCQVVTVCRDEKIKLAPENSMPPVSRECPLFSLLFPFYLVLTG